MFVQVVEKQQILNVKFKIIGNFVYELVFVFNNEDNNEVVWMWVFEGVMFEKKNVFFCEKYCRFMVGKK